MTDDALTTRQRNFIKFMKINDLSFVELSDKTGIPYSTLKSFTSKPGQSMLGKNEQKLAAAFEISSEDIFVNPIQLEQAGLREVADLPKSQKRDGVVQIPEFDIKLSAGGGYFVDQEDVKAQWAFAESYINELRVDPASLTIAEVFGDSMEPTLFGGDRVLINHGDKNAFREGVFAIWNGYATVVKRIQVIDNHRPIKLQLRSDNPAHSPLDYLPDEVNVIGRVVWFARRL